MSAPLWGKSKSCLGSKETLRRYRARDSLAALEKNFRWGRRLNAPLDTGAVVLASHSPMERQGMFAINLAALLFELSAGSDTAYVTHDEMLEGFGSLRGSQSNGATDGGNHSVSRIRAWREREPTIRKVMHEAGGSVDMAGWICADMKKRFLAANARTTFAAESHRPRSRACSQSCRSAHEIYARSREPDALSKGVGLL
jgi:hypothetical protein